MTEAISSWSLIPVISIDRILHHINVNINSEGNVMLISASYIFSYNIGVQHHIKNVLQ